MLQAEGKAEFLAGAANLEPIVRGCELHRQWVDGDEVCSFYDFRIETPIGAASIPMAEWSVVRDGKLTLMKRPSRYSDLVRRLPGMSTTVLADRLRKLEAAGVVERRPGGVGEGVVYAVTDRGHALDEALDALRRCGVTYLMDPTADGTEAQTFDVHYVEGIDDVDDAEFGLVVDGEPTTLRFAGSHLEHVTGEPPSPDLVVHTSSSFLRRLPGT